MNAQCGLRIVSQALGALTSATRFLRTIDLLLRTAAAQTGAAVRARRLTGFNAGSVAARSAAEPDRRGLERVLRRGLSLLRVPEGALGIVLLKHSNAREDRIGSHALLGAVANLALHVPHHALSYPRGSAQGHFVMQVALTPFGLE